MVIYYREARLYNVMINSSFTKIEEEEHIAYELCKEEEEVTENLLVGLVEVQSSDYSGRTGAVDGINNILLRPTRPTQLIEFGL